MKHNFFAWCILGLLSFGFSANAGWSSGGGELIRDARNPWWLSNTLKVQYCILADEQNMGISVEIMRGHVKTALDYWKKQFAKAPNFGEKVKVATQEFTEVACNKDIEFKFQFGVLDAEQFKMIPEPTRFVGLTIRTEYDKVNLAAKGFIYIAPQSGPLKLDLTGLVEKPWSENNGGRLLPILIHELGHVFGLSHQSTVWFMDERMPERLLAPNSLFGIELGRTLFLADETWLLNAFSEVYICPIIETGRPKAKRNSDRFFGFPENGCISYKWSKDKLETWTGSFGKPLYQLGEAPYKKTSKGWPDAVVSLWLPEGQKVIDTEIKNSSVSIVYADTALIAKATYKTLDSKVSRNVSIEFSPRGVKRVSGEMDGIAYGNIFGELSFFENDSKSLPRSTR